MRRLSGKINDLGARRKINTMKTKLTFFILLAFATLTRAQSTDSLAHEGKISSRKLELITCTMNEELSLQAGDSLTMSKYFEKAFGNSTIKGWLEIANVVVVYSSGNTLVVRITEEKSEIMVNDEKVDHFKIENLIKLIR
jgi:hypothetical protein